MRNSILFLAVLCLAIASLCRRSLSTELEKLASHTAFDDAKLVGCTVTHKANEAEPYITLNCTYRCDRPFVASFDAKTETLHTECREPLK